MSVSKYLDGPSGGPLLARWTADIHGQKLGVFKTPVAAEAALASVDDELSIYHGRAYHFSTVLTYNLSGPCDIARETWPYDCNAKDLWPDHVVEICNLHQTWWHGVDIVNQ